jgi:polyphosphate glucokinase
MRTLCIDIGGSGIKAMVCDSDGVPVTERTRVETPQPAVPAAVLSVLAETIARHGEFDRVSVGFPGVVVDGVTKTAPNLTPDWDGILLAAEVSKLAGGKPVRVVNDADVQALAVIEGRGVEMVITLGTGMGSALYVDGKMVPNLELGHHPFKKDKTYEERVSEEARRKVGNARWNRRVREVIAQLEPIFNYTRLYIGGGNTRKLDREGLPANVIVVDNVAGLLGGVKLWDS